MTISHKAVPASQFTFEELTDIYNRGRKDYIVPMSMNPGSMEKYVHTYDIDLDGSFIAMDHRNKVNGICMLGVRQERTWITRLGVIPGRRRQKAGSFLIESEIEASLDLDKKTIQVEVIKGNQPALSLFAKFGFVQTRELLVIHRHPAPVDPALIPDMATVDLEEDDIFEKLSGREKGVAAWTEETSSLRKVGKLSGLCNTLPDGEQGWVVFQKSASKLTNFVFAPEISDTLMIALLAAVHSAHPELEARIYNLPVSHPTWNACRELGYMLDFRRIEMVLDLNSIQ